MAFGMEIRNASGQVTTSTNDRLAIIIGNTLVGPGNTLSGGIMGGAQGWRTLTVAEAPAGSKLWCCLTSAGVGRWEGGAYVATATTIRYRVDYAEAGVYSVLTWGTR